MANYYEILRVSQKASNAEIKSAYRRLARKHHPDVNGGSADTAREFARIAKAYEVLGNRQARAEYDKKLLRNQFQTAADGDSVFASENQHARRWRKLVYERRYNEIIDRMIADERRESLALQKAIFPCVALFVSTLFVAVFRPAFFTNSAIVGKIVFVSLFVAGVIHLFSRLREAFEKYTYRSENLHDSILDGAEPETKPYSRFAAAAFLVIGVAVCLGIGLLVGNYMQNFIHGSVSALSARSLRYEFIFYPPIFVLCVDAMHAFVAKFD